jgi:hypothetical protein
MGVFRRAYNRRSATHCVIRAADLIQELVLVEFGTYAFKPCRCS